MDNEIRARNAVSVNALWKRLRSMEEEQRFDGRPYPAGMSSFPFRLTGQGFFPGGDGLWRDDSQLAHASPGLISLGGAMFLGNDFGTAPSYQKLRRNGFENPLTWKHVKRRVERAGLPPSLMFFTNAVMGLRAGGTALEKKDWDGASCFKSFCREFLTYQIETVKPRLIVVMGPVARSTLNSLEVGAMTASGRFHAMKARGHETTALFTTHPYGDFNFDHEGRMRDSAELREAWDWAQSQYSQ
jgi:hypothetical protein